MGERYNRYGMRLLLQIDDHSVCSVPPQWTDVVAPDPQVVITVLIEQLPLLIKTRAAYEEAMRASAEIRKILDAEEQNLRTLMTQLEEGLSVHDSKAVPDKKGPEPARVERMGGTAEGARRAIQWP